MAQLHVYSAGYTTRDSENQKKANARHVLIPNFLAVAKAMKTTLPEGLVSPCGLFAVFEAVTRAITESESSPARAELGARLSGCLSMAAARTLDIPELQMLVEFAGDPNGLDFHHRIRYRVDRSTWIISTPDYDVYEEDFDGVTVVPLSRNSEYPGAYAGQMYIPRNQELMRSYLEIKRQADSLAVVRGYSDRPGVASGGDAAETGHWRIADVDSKRFGDIIPASDLADVTKNVILERNGAGFREATTLLESMSDSKFTDWPHRGPKAVKDFLESILQNGGDIMTYHSSFMRKSGLSENSAAAHE
ncbi:unnamed protein product [Durusdinium trenchii]|uniref:Uncharacterized protein n=1 Tax=Durusdinium trenchii TaxID=1381693 RepID=A0ABP0NQ96_9DINO